MLLEEYVSQIDNYPPERLDIQIKNLEFQAADAILEFSVCLDIGDCLSTTYYKLSITGYEKSNIKSSRFSSIALSSTHALLWEYNDLQTSLYFNGMPDTPYKLFWELNKVHESVLGSYLPFNAYLNREFTGQNLLNAKYGLFASGPKKLLSLYAVCLEQEGVNYSMINENKPWLYSAKEGRFVREFQYPKVLFLDGSFIIAMNFDIEEII